MYELCINMLIYHTASQWRRKMILSRGVPLDLDSLLTKIRGLTNTKSVEHLPYLHEYRAKTSYLIDNET